MSQFNRRVTTSLGDAFISPAVQQQNVGDDLVQLAGSLQDFGANLGRLNLVRDEITREKELEEGKKLAARYNINSAERFNELQEAGIIPASANPHFMEGLKTYTGRNSGRAAANRIKLALQQDPEFLALESADAMEAKWNEMAMKELDALGDFAMDAAPEILTEADDFITRRINAVGQEAEQAMISEAAEDTFQTLKRVASAVNVDLSTAESYDQFNDIINSNLSNLPDSVRRATAMQLAENLAMAYDDPDMAEKLLKQIPFSDGVSMADTAAGMARLGDLRDRHQRQLSEEFFREEAIRKSQEQRILDEYAAQRELRMADPENNPASDPSQLSPLIRGKILAQERALQRELLSLRSAELGLAESQLQLEYRQRQSRFQAASDWASDPENAPTAFEIVQEFGLSNLEAVRVLTDVAEADRRFAQLGQDAPEASLLIAQRTEQAAFGRYGIDEFEQDIQAGLADPKTLTSILTRSINENTQKNAAAATTQIGAFTLDYSARMQRWFSQNDPTGLEFSEATRRSIIEGDSAKLRNAVEERLIDVLPTPEFRSLTTSQKNAEIQAIIDEEAKKIPSLLGDSMFAEDSGQEDPGRTVTPPPSDGGAADLMQSGARQFLMQDPFLAQGTREASEAKEVEARAERVAKAFESVARVDHHLETTTKGTGLRSHSRSQLNEALNSSWGGTSVRIGNLVDLAYNQTTDTPQYQITVPDWMPKSMRADVVTHANLLMNSSDVEQSLRAAFKAVDGSRRPTPNQLQNMENVTSSYTLVLARAHAHAMTIGKKIETIEDPRVRDSYTAAYAQLRAMYGVPINEFQRQAQGNPTTAEIRLFPSETFAYALGVEYARQLEIDVPTTVEEVQDMNHPFNKFMQTQLKQVRTSGAYDPSRVFGL